MGKIYRFVGAMVFGPFSGACINPVAKSYIRTIKQLGKDEYLIGHENGIIGINMPLIGNHFYYSHLIFHSL